MAYHTSSLHPIIGEKSSLSFYFINGNITTSSSKKKKPDIKQELTCICIEKVVNATKEP